VSELTPASAARLGTAIVDEVERAVVGRRDVIETALVCLVGAGHIVIEDVPGVAKTVLAASLARASGLSWSRVQFTPDLMPADVTGSAVFDPVERTFEFRAGPLFAQLVLGDEINRAPPKTQAAMLEAMAEGQVTVDGVSRPLPRPFLVIATQNPIEFEGTYPLPEAQLDRFMVRLRMGYPSDDDERELVRRRLGRRQEIVEIRAVATPEDLVALQRAVEDVTVTDAVVDYLVALVAATRRAPNVRVGASPRATLALLRAARARALLAGRDWVAADDVKSLAVPVLAHRLMLDAELWVRGSDGSEVVQACLDSVAVPSAAAELARADGP